MKIPQTVEQGYSLWDNSYLKQCGKREDNDNAKSDKKASFTFLFKDTDYLYII